MNRKPPPEAVQISAQIFAIEMAKHLVRDKQELPGKAIATSVKNTRRCMDNLGLTMPKRERF